MIRFARQLVVSCERTNLHMQGKQQRRRNFMDSLNDAPNEEAEQVAMLKQYGMWRLACILRYAQ